MTNFIQIHWSCGSLDEARKVARYLVQERYVATAKIIPWIESIYMLNNQLDTIQESCVIMQTTLELFEEIKKIIIQNSKYQIPEITYVTIAGGNEEFLAWLKER